MTARFVHTTLVVGARGRGQDRAAVREVDDRIVVVLADGAGGTGSGGEAAQAIVDGVLAATTADWSQLLRALIDLVRLPSGKLQDDVAIVLCRDATLRQPI